MTGHAVREGCSSMSGGFAQGDLASLARTSKALGQVWTYLGAARTSGGCGSRASKEGPGRPWAEASHLCPREKCLLVTSEKHVVTAAFYFGLWVDWHFKLKVINPSIHCVGLGPTVPLVVPLHNPFGGQWETPELGGPQIIIAFNSQELRPGEQLPRRGLSLRPTPVPAGWGWALRHKGRRGFHTIMYTCRRFPHFPTAGHPVVQSFLK